MMNFLQGSIFVAFLVTGLFFTRFYLRSRDRFFAMFSGAFLLLSTERLLLALIDPNAETRSSVYVLRLFAFIVIIVAIIEKNRAKDPAAGTS